MFLNIKEMWEIKKIELGGHKYVFTRKASSSKEMLEFGMFFGQRKLT